MVNGLPLIVMGVESKSTRYGAFSSGFVAAGFVAGAGEVAVSAVQAAGSVSNIASTQEREIAARERTEVCIVNPSGNLPARIVRAAWATRQPSKNPPTASGQTGRGDPGCHRRRL